MSSRFLLILIFVLLVFTQAWGEESPATVSETGNKKVETKELSGMSIVGNDEAPKSLYIVPWKSSELGAETSMNMMLNERDVPVDREVFMRQLGYFEVSSANSRVQLQE